MFKQSIGAIFIMMVLALTACDQLPLFDRATTDEAAPAATPEADYFATDEYSAAVSYTIEEADGFPFNTPAAPEGQRWVYVLAALNNVGGAPVAVTQDTLILIDENGSRYLAEAPDEATQPALVGETLATDSSLYGLARFALPTGVQAVILEWCPFESCEQPIRAPVP